MPDTTATVVEVEPYKLSEIFSIIPEFDGDQIFLGNFIDACDCAFNMATTQQKVFLLIHIKNKMRGRAAQLISSRNPGTYAELKHLLNLHFGDSRDLSSLIQDLQRLKQLPNESPLTFYNRLQVLNSKLLANIQKSGLSRQQKDAQTSLIETMALNALLTGLDFRLGQLIRASNPQTLLEAQSRIRRELQLSYFEQQKSSRLTQNPKPQTKPNSIPRCNNCGRSGHISSQCRQTSNQRPPQFNHNFQRPVFDQRTNSSPMQRPIINNNNNNAHSNRPTNFTPNESNFQPRSNSYQRPFNSNGAQRTLHVQYEDFPNQSFNEQIETETFHQLPNNELYQINENLVDTSYSHETESSQDFQIATSSNHPPENSTISNPVSQIQSQLQTLNFDDMNPNMNFPEQQFL